MKSINGAHVPFPVNSDISFEQILILISQKLNCFPGLLKLRYRLDSDKARAPAMSIQTEEELEMFMSRMRTLIIPGKLANGKKSTHAKKAVTVYFEDANTENVTRDVSEGTGKSLVNMVGNVLVTFSFTNIHLRVNHPLAAPMTPIVSSTTLVMGSG